MGAGIRHPGNQPSNRPCFNFNVDLNSHIHPRFRFEVGAGWLPIRRASCRPTAGLPVHPTERHPPALSLCAFDLLVSLGVLSCMILSLLPQLDTREHTLVTRTNEIDA